MNAKSRRRIEMGTRALGFSRAHPDESPGYAAALTRLEERLDRAVELAGLQRKGILQVRASTARKRELRLAMRKAHLDHLAKVARIAAREVPELAQKLTLRGHGPPDARQRQRGAPGGGGRDLPDRAGDGRAQPLPVHERPGAAGGVGEREQRDRRAEDHAEAGR